jgi:hypothetical protein
MVKLFTCSAAASLELTTLNLGTIGVFWRLGLEHAAGWTVDPGFEH